MLKITSTKLISQTVAKKYRDVFNSTNSQLRIFHTSQTKCRIYENDRKDGYDTTNTHGMTNFDHFKNGFKMLKGEIRLWAEEMKEKFNDDPILTYRPGETDIVCLFDKEEIIDKFILASDSDFGEGYSHCKMEMSKAGRVMFSGYLDTTVPKDGMVKKAGYCAFRSTRKVKSFRRDDVYNWAQYNTIVLKVRGDGRNYAINLSIDGYFDTTWNDMYHYVFYTRGGPYWQITKIPFSKFVFASKGRIQDKQQPIPLHRVTHYGIVIADKVDSPFNLEIEYIGVEFDPQNSEEFAYENYKTPPGIVGS